MNGEVEEYQEEAGENYFKARIFQYIKHTLSFLVPFIPKQMYFILFVMLFF
jgi:hypothetical protein